MCQKVSICLQKMSIKGYSPALLYFDETLFMTKLSPRERDCLYWAATGKSDKQIACILSLSLHTVNHCLRSIFKKFNVNNRLAAVMHALKEDEQFRRLLFGSSH